MYITKKGWGLFHFRIGMDQKLKHSLIQALFYRAINSSIEIPCKISPTIPPPSHQYRHSTASTSTISTFNRFLASVIESLHLDIKKVHPSGITCWIHTPVQLPLQGQRIYRKQSLPGSDIPSHCPSTTPKYQIHHPPPVSSKTTMAPSNSMSTRPPSSLYFQIANCQCRLVLDFGGGEIILAFPCHPNSIWHIKSRLERV